MAGFLTFQILGVNSWSILVV